MNDILVEQSNETGMHNTLININQAILKSGTYNFRIKVYPTVGEEKGIEPQTLSFLKVGLAKYEKIPVGEGVMPDTYQYIQNYPIAKIERPIPFYEIKGEFKAEVSYEVEGWTKGQDLRKLDQELVRKKAEEFYTICGQIFENKNLDDWLKLKYPFISRTMSSSYVDDQYLEELLNEYKSDVKDYEYTMKPIKGYKLEYMGQGKLIRLITDNQRPKLRGGGALLLGYGKSSTYQPGITLYLPEGRNLATQGFIMWK